MTKFVSFDVRDAQFGRGSPFGPETDTSSFFNSGSGLRKNLAVIISFVHSTTGSGTATKFVISCKFIFSYRLLIPIPIRNTVISMEKYL